MWHMEKKNKKMLISRWGAIKVPLPPVAEDITAGLGPPSSKFSIDLHFMVIHLLGSMERKRRWSVDTDARPGGRDINQGYSHSFHHAVHSALSDAWQNAASGHFTLDTGVCGWGAMDFQQCGKADELCLKHTICIQADEQNYPLQPNRPCHRKVPLPPGQKKNGQQINLVKIRVFREKKEIWCKTDSTGLMNSLSSCSLYHSHCSHGGRKCSCHRNLSQKLWQRRDNSCHF